MRIAGLIGYVSPSDPEYLDGDLDHIECLAQEIVGEINVRSHVLNGLLGRANQTDFFHRLHFDCAVGGLIRSGNPAAPGAAMTDTPTQELLSRRKQPRLLKAGGEQDALGDTFGDLCPFARLSSHAQGFQVVVPNRDGLDLLVFEHLDRETGI